MKKLKLKTNPSSGKCLLIPFLIIALILVSTSSFSSTKVNTPLKEDKIAEHNSALAKHLLNDWLKKSWNAYDNYVIGFEYAPKGSYIAGEPLFPTLPEVYKNEIENGTYQYLGSFASTDNLKKEVADLTEDFYNNDFSVIALKPENGIRKVYIESLHVKLK